MKVRSYLTLLTLAGFAGQLILGTVLWWIYTGVDEAEEKLSDKTRQISFGSEEIDSIEIAIRSINDAINALDAYPQEFQGVFGVAKNHMVYADKSLEKLRDLKKKAPWEILTENLLHNTEVQLLEFKKELTQYEALALSRKWDKRSATRIDAMAKLDAKAENLLNVSTQLNDLLEPYMVKVRKERDSLQDELVHRRNVARLGDVVAIAFYIAFAVFLAWWTYRSLAKPIQTLETATSHSLDEQKPFILAETGPEEIRSLTRRLRVLVHGLEEQVAQRTHALRTKAHQLEEEMMQRKHLETQLVHAQKMEAVGQLAAGIAHEINSPSQFVNDNVMFLKDAVNELLAAVSGEGEIPDDKEIEFLRENAPGSVDQALQGMERITTIVKSMKNFAYRDAASEKRPQNLNQAIEATAVVATNEWKYHAELKTDLDPNLPFVPCNIGEINQVVLNLIVNAAHAIRDSELKDGKGLILVSTRQYDQYVVITIQDDGGGIPEHVQAKIFEPFFTTKEVGVGTGQGLAIAHNVITKSHGGHIWFETEQGKGTTFFIRLSLESTPQAADS